MAALNATAIELALVAAAAKVVSLRYMASDGGGGGIVQDRAKVS